MRTKSTAAPLAGSLAGLLAALASLAACSLEPGTTRERTAAALGLAAGAATATVRVPGEPALAGAAAVECGPVGGGEHGEFRLHLAPAGAAETRIVVVVPEFHGAGDYRASISVVRSGPTGAATSAGTAEVRLANATDAAGAHAVSGSLRGRFAGDAGAAELEAEFADCYFFD